MKRRTTPLLVAMALVASIPLLAGCDEARTPCVEVEGSSVILWTSCPGHEAAELSSLVVYEGETAVWSIANSSRDNEIDRIVYGETPAGWTTALAPQPLEAGGTYSAAFTYYDAPSQSAEFTAP